MKKKSKTLTMLALSLLLAGAVTMGWVGMTPANQTLLVSNDCEEDDDKDDGPGPGDADTMPPEIKA